MKRSLAGLALLPASFAVMATVNVNTAQQSDLQRTKGLDKHKAKALIEYRAQNGPLDSFEDLEKVPGFTPAAIEAVRPQIAFKGDAFTPTPAKSEAPKKK